MNIRQKAVPVFVLFSLIITAHTIQAKEVLIRGLDVVASTDAPMGQGSFAGQSLLPEDSMGSSSDDELFGVEGGGYFHPFISLGGEYTDNLFNLDENETSNFLTTINPGIWLAIPSRKEIPLAIATNNSSVGGLPMSLDRFTTFDKMNIYLLGGVNYRNYSEDSELNDFDARLEGLFKYNLRSGISLQVVDSFNRSQDRFDVENSSAESVSLYQTNLLLADLDWDFSEKFSTEIEYSNFILDYREQDDAWLNRTDNAISWHGYYKYSLKTLFLLEYRYIDVAYDTRESKFKDAENHFIFGGLDWISTEKTAFHFKLGYQQRKYKNDRVNDAIDASENIDNSSIALQMSLDYAITTKTKLIFSVNNSIEETDSQIALEKEVLSGSIHYEQEFTDRFIGLCDLRYENTDYTEYSGTNREDDRYTVTPALQYIFKDWLMAELGYTYESRDSSIAYYNYDTNTISFTLNSSL